MSSRTGLLICLVLGFGTSACSQDMQFQSSAASSPDDQNVITQLPPGLIGKVQSLDVKANKNVDILFVVDNSVSMQEEQANISQKIPGFMPLLQNLNWHIALTTTDANALTKAPDGVKRPWSDGQLRPFDSDTGTMFVLKPESVSLSTAQTQLANALNVGLSGSGDERAIYNSYRAIERIDSTAANADFSRADAALVIIAISDEDECSNGKCNGVDPQKSVPANLLSMVRERFGSSKVFSFNSIARAATDTACHTAVVTPTYETMTNLTGGVMGSVCATDYTPVLANIGQKVIELVKSVNLDCSPVDIDGDGKVDLKIVLADGTQPTTGFTVSGTTVTFGDSLPAGIHTFTYACAK